MLSRIFKLTLVIVIIAILVWLKTINDNITITLGDYLIYTTTFNIIITLLIIVAPVWLIIFIISSIVKFFKNRAYLNSITQLIKTFDLHEDKDILLDLILHDTKTKNLRQIKKLISLIEKDKFDQALYLSNKIKVNSKLQYIIKRYIGLAYKGKKDVSNFVSNAKNNINHNTHNFWFFKELADYYFVSNNMEDIQYLKSILSRINFPTKKEEKLYTSIINFKSAEHLININKKPEALSLAKTTLNLYPDFSPMYKIIGDISKKDTSININKYLQQAWYSNNNYFVIELWRDYYHLPPKKDLSDVLDNISKKNNNPPMDALLKAAMYIKERKYIEAYDILSSVPDSLPEKQLVELQLMHKEKDYSKIELLIDKLYNKYLDLSWWGTYI